VNAPERIVPEFAPGVVAGMPFDVYHATEALSASGAKKLLRSPMHYRLERDQPGEPTDAMNFGTAVHVGVLEPDQFDARICCAPKVDRRTTVGKATWEKFVADSAGKLVLAQDAFDRARRCVDAVHAHPAARRLLDGGERELSLFWHDGKWKVPCKARYDLRSHGGITDLKTCQDASPEGFGRAIASFQYHLQAAIYVSGAEHLLDASPQFFAFIAVESEPPHAVGCYALPGNAILAGIHLMNRAMSRYAAAIESSSWPGYADTIETIQLPKYALRFD
jgi:exodeoxyribonuclease VIII